MEEVCQQSILEIPAMKGKIPTGSRSKKPNYIGWRAEELARLALLQVPSWSVTDTTRDGKFDYVVLDVATGASFMVEVKAFSSIHELHNFAETAPELTQVVTKKTIQDAKAMSCPVYLFVFDADTGHGRYKRLDTVQLDDVIKDQFHLGLLKENTINSQSMLRLAKELSHPQKDHKEPVAV